MGVKILVYDNQLAYFELLKTYFTGGHQFVLINSNTIERAGLEYDMVLFFVYDEIELLDLAKIHSEEVPYVLGLSGKNMPVGHIAQGNIQYLNVDKLKNELLADIKILLDKLIIV